MANWLETLKFWKPKREESEAQNGVPLRAAFE